jgi:hypothetical protein
VSFDHYPGGAPVGSGDVIADQFPGVSFFEPARAAALGPGTQSPPNALRSDLECGARGCPAHALRMRFSDPASLVRVAAGVGGGQAESELGGTWARLVGYATADGRGTPVAQSPDAQLGGPVTTQLEMRASAASIRSATLYVGIGTATHDNEPRRAFLDDLTWGATGDPPPPEPDPPTITIAAPRNGDQFQQARDVTVAGRLAPVGDLHTFCLTAGAAATGTSFPEGCHNLGTGVRDDGTFTALPVERLVPGRNTITAWVRDGRGREARASVEVEIGGAGTADVRLQNLEVTQSVQWDMRGLPVFERPQGFLESRARYFGVPLAPGGKTVVRVYANVADRGRLAQAPRDVPMLLYGFDEDSNTPLPGSPIRPEWSPPQLSDGAAPVTAAQRADPNGAYTFTLPPSWTGFALPAERPGANLWRERRIRLRAELNPRSVTPALPECSNCHLNNVLSVREIDFVKRFTPSAPWTRFFMSSVEVIASPGGFTSRPPPPRRVYERVRTLTPVGEGEFPDQPYAGSVDVTDLLERPGISDGERGWLMWHRVSAFDVSEAAPGRLMGIAGFDVPGRALFAPTRVDRIQWLGLATARRPLTSVGHEMYHVAEYNHAGGACGGDRGEVPVAWPPDGFGQIAGYGLDRRPNSNGAPTRTRGPYRIIADPAPDPPWYDPAVIARGTMTPPPRGKWFDFMSYCAYTGPEFNAWISGRNWTYFLDGNIRCTLNLSCLDWDPRPRPRRGPVGQGPPGPAPTTVAQATDQPTRRVVAIAPDDAPPTIIGVTAGTDEVLGGQGDASPFEFSVHAADGRELTRVPAIPVSGHVNRGEAVTVLTAQLPAGEAAQIDLLRGGETVATRRRSANAPQVELLTPRAGARVGPRSGLKVSWRASDADDDPLELRVEYSREDGRGWRALHAAGPRDSVTLPASYLEGSRRARVRVIADDGFERAVAVSPRFSVATRPPSVHITSPGTGAAVPADGTLYLAGQAYDERRRPLPDARFRWYVGRRLVGRGRAVGATGLPPGTRTVRLVVRDRGSTATASVRVRILRVTPRLLDLRVPRRLAPSARQLALRARASVPATARIGRRSFRLGTRARRMVVPIAPARRPLVLSIRLQGGGGRATVPIRLARR